MLTSCPMSNDSQIKTNKLWSVSGYFGHFERMANSKGELACATLIMPIVEFLFDTPYCKQHRGKMV